MAIIPRCQVLLKREVVIKTLNTNSRVPNCADLSEIMPEAPVLFYFYFFKSQCILNCVLEAIT